MIDRNDKVWLEIAARIDARVKSIQQRLCIRIPDEETEALRAEYKAYQMILEMPNELPPQAPGIDFNV